MSVAALDLDLEVFQGPFDLLLTLVLREEVDLLEVELADVVIAYIDHLDQRGELDLEAATEFLVLIAALLELKSRLMLPGEDEEGLDLGPGEAAEELLARMLEYRRYRTAAEYLKERLAAEEGHRYRSAPLPPALRRVSVELAEAVYAPDLLAEAVGGLLRMPPKLDLGHVARAHVTVEQRLAHVRTLLRRLGSFTFDDAVRGADRLTEAVTLVRAARALQGRRGRLGAERGLRPDHDRGRRRVERSGPHHRGASVPLVRARFPGAARRRLRVLARARSSRRWRGCESTTPRASAAWCCARWRAASRSPRTRWPSTPRAGCWPSPAPRRSPRPRPSAWGSSPTCSRSPGPRWRASAAWPRSPPSARCWSGG